MAYRTEFVNRVPELKVLKKFLSDETTERIAVLVAAHGMGKTWLLDELCNDSIIQKMRVRVLNVNLTPLATESSFESLVSSIQLGLTEEHNVALRNAKKKIDETKTPVPITVNNYQRKRAEGTDITVTAPVEQLAGRDIININALPTSTLEPDWEQEKLTDALYADIVPLARSEIIFFILENWQEANLNIREWLKTKLIQPTQRDPAWRKVRILIASTIEVPEVSTKPIEISRLEEDSVKEYWEKKMHLPLPIPADFMKPMVYNPLRMSRLTRWASIQLNAGKLLTLPEAVNDLLNDPLCFSETIARAIERCALVRNLRSDIWNELESKTPQESRVTLEALGKAIGDWNLGEVTDEHISYRSDIRSELLRWWRETREEEEFRRLNTLIIAIYESRGNPRDGSESGGYQPEAIYHRFLIDENDGLEKLIESFEDTYSQYTRTAFDQAENLLKAAKEFEQRLQPLTQAWLRYFDIRIDWVLEQLSSEQVDKELQRISLEFANDTSILAKVLCAAVGWTRGEIASTNKQWQEGVHTFKQSLDLLHRIPTYRYDVRIKISLGNTFSDLAEVSGGFPNLPSSNSSDWRGFLVGLQHLPFTGYSSVVHRVGILPNLYFGTNYQSWLIAHLLMQAQRAYKDADVTLMHSVIARGSLENNLQAPGLGSGAGWRSRVTKLYTNPRRKNVETAAENSDLKRQLAEIGLRIAEIDHRLGLWSTAKKRYQDLREDVNLSIYRQAQVALGYGRSLLDEGNAADAIDYLLAALDKFHAIKSDRHSIATATALLGRAYSSKQINKLKDALDYYEESIEVYGSIKDYIRQTQISWELESLLTRSTGDEKVQKKIKELLAPLNEWHYIARFPAELLHWIRLFSVGCALPLSVIFFTIAAGLLALMVVAVESHVETVVEILFLPLVALWLYTGVYSIIGYLMVRYLGGRLVRIERDQPDTIQVTAEKLIYKTPQDKPLEILWENIDTIVTANYYGFSDQPISLSSKILIAGGEKPIETLDVTAEYEKPMEILGVTAGYEHLIKNIETHLKKETRDKPISRFPRDIKLFTSLLIGTLIALFIRFETLPKITVSDITNSSTSNNLPVTAFVLFYLIVALFVLPCVLLWQLTLHRIRVRRLKLSKPMKKFIPFGVILAVTAIFTLLLLGFIAVVQFAATIHN